MKKNLIFKCRQNNISGYKQIIDKTYNILNKHYDLTCLTLYNEKHPEYKSVFDLNKETIDNKEFLIAPLELNEEMSWNSLMPNKKNLSILTMWESTRVPAFCVNQLNNNFKNVFVPSSWNLHYFKNSNVNNVSLLNLFVDDEKFFYRPKPDLNKFTFFAGANLHNFSLSHVRKNLQIIIDCFVKVFKNISDVELVIKCTSTGKNEIRYCLDERIKIIRNFLPVDDFVNLYVNSDVFVSVSKSEGWGFFQIESLAVGRPIISVDYSGTKDFCNSENSFFIDYKESLASGYWARENGLWAEFDINSLCEKMHWCYQNKDAIRDNWLKYSQSVLPKFSLKNYEASLINSLNF
jgi:glycosyltransferase involved in cell wall biosynthesis